MAKVAKKGSALMAPMTPSKELAVIVGSKPLSRGEVMKKIWAYIKGNDLQDKKDKRVINPDDKLSPILGKKPINMFKMTAELSKHLTK